VTWLFVPYMGSPSVQAVEDWTSAWASQNPDIGLSVSSSGKPTPQPASWRGWKTRPWATRLSGMTLRPSTASRGVESWISYWRATRASRSPSPESSGEPKTSGISGRTSRESFESANPSGSSSRTSRDMFGLAISTSLDPSYRAWATRLRRDYSRRQKLALRTSGRGSSSWPTPDAGLLNEGESPESFKARQQRLLEQHKNGNGMGTPLGMAAQNWNTPRAAADKMGLATTASAWGTPTSRDADKWHYREPGHERQVNLSGQASTYSLPVPTSESNGQPSSESAPTSRRRLNPLFVEWLMGWPEGHACVCGKKG